MSSFLLLVLKIVLSAGMVVAITLTAERVSTRLAGVLAGFPLGAGLTLLFLGLEQGAAFAAQSSLWSIQGILALLGFCWCYRAGALLFKDGNIRSLFACCFLGLTGYFVTTVVLKVTMPGSAVIRTFLVVLLLFIPAVFFRRSPGGKIREKVEVSWSLLAIRAFFAAFVILSVTSIAAWIGPVWAGLLAAFPTVILPSVMILHFHYGGESVPAFFRDTPLALPAIIVFSLSVHWTFPLFGVWAGTLFSYMAALGYLVVYEFRLRAFFDRILPS